MTATLAISSVGVGTQLGGEPILHRLDLAIWPGEIVSLIGPSGCGKSTLLRLISGLERDHTGELQVAGRAVRGPDRTVGFMFQEPRLLPWLTVRDNVALGAPRGRSETRARVDDLLAQVQLAGAGDAASSVGTAAGARATTGGFPFFWAWPGMPCAIEIGRLRCPCRMTTFCVDEPVAVLKGQRIGLNNGAGFIRKALVVTQFTVSVILIVCTVIIYQQVQHIKDRDLGYNRQELLYTSLTGNLAEHFNAMKAGLLQTGVVENAALTESPPLQMWSTTTSDMLTWEGGDPGKKIRINWEGASPEYLPTMGLQLVAGRNFHPDIHSDSGNVIINQSFATIMGKAGRVGALITYGDTSKRYYHVIGIVKDYLFNDLAGTSIPPLMMSCDPEVNGNYSFLTIRLKPSKDLTAQLAKMEAVMRSDNPGYPFDFQFVDEQFNQQFQWQAHIGTLAGVFSVLAVLISCLGLFGLAAYTAERRTKEIGIRKVLGASVSGLAALLSAEFLKLVALSCLIAFPVAWWVMHGWLADFPYRTAIHWWVFGLAGVAAVAITLLTVSWQAIRTALSNPVESLRAE